MHIRSSHPITRRINRPRNHPLPLALRRRDEPTDDRETSGLVRDAKLARVEAALFLADEPLTSRKIATAAELSDGTEARRLVLQLQNLYDADGSAFTVQEIAGGFQLSTRPVYHTWLMRLKRSRTDLRLSNAAMETLAIVAYRQPIMRADIEAIRGVQCGEILTQLMEKGLIRIAGRHDSLGRPVLYGTSRKFLSLFGLATIDDLPNLAQFRAPPKSD